MTIIQTLLDSNLFQTKKIIQRYEFLKLSGSIDTNIYFIEKGSVRIFVNDDKEERIVALATKKILSFLLILFYRENLRNFIFKQSKKRLLELLPERILMNLFNSVKRI